MTDLTLWKVLIREHTDDTVAEELKPEGEFRHLAVKLEEDTNQYLDHDLYYTELVQLT